MGRGGAEPLGWRDATAALDGFATERPAVGVFESRAELVEFLRESALRGRLQAEGSIDFGRERAVLVAAGPRSSGGYRIEVASVTERRREVGVAVRELTPVLGSGAPARVTYPFRLIVVPADDKPVKVQWLGRADRGAG